MFNEKYMKKIILLFALAFLGFSLHAQQVAAQTGSDEKINSFESVMRLSQDGGAQITETITLTSRGQKIIKGINRALSLKLNDGKVKYSNLTLKTGGQEYPVAAQVFGNFLGAALEPGQKLEDGTHVFEFSYKAENLIKKDSKQDTLNWLVTGNRWPVNIDKVSITIILPGDAKEDLADMRVFVRGADGALNPAGSVSEDLYFTSAEPLKPREGITLDASFDKSIFSPSQKTPLFVFPIFGLIAAGFLMYFLSIVKEPPLRPHKNAIFSQPPEDTDPLDAYCIMSKGKVTKQGAMSLSLIIFAVKNAAVIGKKMAADFTANAAILSSVAKSILEKNAFYFANPKPSSYGFLPPEERHLFTITFPRGNGLTFKEYNSNAARAAKDVFSYAKSRSKKYARPNSRAALSVYIIFSLYAAAGVLFLNFQSAFDKRAIVLYLFPFLLAAFLWVLVKLSRNISELFSARMAIVRSAFFMAAGAALCGGYFFVVNYFYNDALFAFVYVACVLALLIFGATRRARNMYYTPWGRQMLTEMLRFKLYLESGNDGALSKESIENGVNTFCDNLPWAVALCAESKWTAHFVRQLNTAEGKNILEKRGFLFSHQEGIFRTSAVMGGLKRSIKTATTPPFMKRIEESVNK